MEAKATKLKKITLTRQGLIISGKIIKTKFIILMEDRIKSYF
jgi:hypothetical protein